MSAFVTAACTKCRAAFDEVCAREPMPAKHDPERCQCGALLSFRYQDPTDPSGQRWIRRRIKR